MPTALYNRTGYVLALGFLACDFILTCADGPSVALGIRYRSYLSIRPWLKEYLDGSGTLGTG